MLQKYRDNKSRILQKLDERINHIISACLMLAKEQYVKLCYRVCVLKCTLTYARKQG